MPPERTKTWLKRRGKIWGFSILPIVPRNPVSKVGNLASIAAIPTAVTGLEPVAFRCLSHVDVAFVLHVLAPFVLPTDDDLVVPLQ